MAKEPKTKLAALAEGLGKIKAKDIMTKDVITATPGTQLAEIAGHMIKSRISGLPVVDKKGGIAGVITANDLFLVMDMIRSGDVVEAGHEGVFNPTVEFAMSTEVVKITKDTKLDEIIYIMKYKNAFTIPVFEGEEMVGVIGRRDVFKNFYEVLKQIYS